MPGDSEDRTLAASARRLQKARDEGDIPVSRELTLLAGLAGGGFALMVQLAAGGATAQHWFVAMLQRPGVQGAAAVAAGGIVWAVAPAALGAVAAVLAVGALQTGFLLRPAALQPDLGRISPGRGIKRLFSIETLVQAGKSLVKLSVLSLALWLALRRIMAGVNGEAGWEAAGLLQRLLREGERLALVLVGAQVALAGFDFAWVRLQHARRMRMSRQDQRDEHKEAEGNPMVRQRLRQLARSRAKRRMMAAVKRAAVVVTNPSHYAVALEYRRGSRAAPRVVAKGVDEMAQRIREEAQLHRIPMVANPGLARALYRVELDTEIPMEHFKAVAEIVAYVWRMQTRPKL